jgi:hypothetical protein
VPLPKNPDEWHWRKKFLMPKPYLYKLHVLLGYSSKQIAELHKKKLGFSVSERLVRDYLNKYEIYRPAPTREEKKKAKRLIVGPRSSKWNTKRNRKQVDYLNHRLFLRRGVKPYVDSLTERYRKNALNMFFRSAAKKKLTRNQKNTLRFIFQSYEVTPSVIDLIFPNRYVLIDWVRIEEIRKELGVDVKSFFKKIKVARYWYYVVQNKKPPTVGYRSTVLRIVSGYKSIKTSEISKEIIKWKKIL